MLDRLASAALLASQGLLLVMLALISLEIVLRNGFGRSTMIADEYGGYLFCWLSLLGFVHAARHDEFIRVSFLLDRLGGGGRTLATIFGALVGLCLSGIVCYATASIAWTSYRFGAAASGYFATPLAVPQAMMPLAFLLLCIIFAAQIVEAALGIRREPHSKMEERF